MGAWINVTNHIHIADKSFGNGVLKGVGYNVNGFFNIKSYALYILAKKQRKILKASAGFQT